uniref:non-specific serine/threonine protein kinase n=1 Tax=Rhinolophus ferrumequinum TaxID=59479 RepID=A0A671EG58_RHIFE
AQEGVIMSRDPAATSKGRKPHLVRYELLQTIGEGNHAKVKLGQHLPTGTQVAIKIIRKQGFNNQQRPVLKEAHCMAGLRHPNIVQLFEVINTKVSLFIIMEHVTGGDMQDYILTHGCMTEGEARRSFRQLVSAVHYCHEKGIIHRDLKPQNVLFDTEMNVKLTDFGISTPFNGNKLSTCCGSPAYAAPELLREEEYDGPPVDIWSLGVLLYKMVTGTIPFKGKDLIELVSQILKGTYTLPLYLTAELHTLLRRATTRLRGSQARLPKLKCELDQADV